MLIYFIITLIIGIIIAFLFIKNLQESIIIVFIFMLLSGGSIFGVCMITKNNNLSYKEFWSGIEQEAIMDTIKCERDGSCHNTYSCDPYQVSTTETYTDANGKIQTRVVTRTQYHSCPYTDYEYTYTVKDNIGESYIIGKNYLPENPNEHRWRYDAPTNLEKYNHGVPQLWLDAKTRIDNNTPSGTTVIKTYPNYIQASQNDIYKKQSNEVEIFKEQELLPKITTTTYDFYQADKFYVVGEPINESSYIKDLQNLNGYFGSKLQGDIHMVIVNNKNVNADNYTQALQAYFSSPELGKNILSKNGVVIVLGVEDSTINWAKTFTGMPNGNEHLNFSSLKGQKLNSKELLDKDNGSISKVLFDAEKGYQRVSMKDYEYLKDSIPTPTYSYWIASIINIVIILILIKLRQYYHNH